MPKKIRELKAQLSKAGFILLPKRGKASHSRWKHPLLPYLITLSGNDGDDAQRYQEKDAADAPSQAFESLGQGAAGDALYDLEQLQQQEETEEDTTL